MINQAPTKLSQLTLEAQPLLQRKYVMPPEHTYKLAPICFDLACPAHGIPIKHKFGEDYHQGVPSILLVQLQGQTYDYGFKVTFEECEYIVASISIYRENDNEGEIQLAPGVTIPSDCKFNHLHLVSAEMVEIDI